ncbi:MAG: hypothetical protein ACYTFM_04535, partial [Planctomycetota bacterium]
DLPTDNPGWEEFQFGIDGGVIYIDEVIIDTICYEGEEPPAGPGRVGAPQGVTEESPEVKPIIQTRTFRGRSTTMCTSMYVKPMS